MAAVRLVLLALSILFSWCHSFRVPRLSDELGCSPTLSFLLDRERYERDGPFLYFDPLDIATDGTFSRFREAELKHGRVAMLALTEIMLTPALKHWGIAPRTFPESVIGALPNLQWRDMVKVILVCLLLETVVFVQKDPKDMPGDYGTGFFGLRDKTIHEDKLVVELEHGRLAMVAFTGFLASDILTNGQPWIEQWRHLSEHVERTF